jgi:hypothetical protein
MALGFNGYWGNSERGLVGSIWILVSSVLFVPPGSVIIGCAHNHWVFWLSQRLSPSLSRVNSKMHRSGPGGSENFRVISPLETSFTGPFGLDKRSLSSKLTPGCVTQQKRNVFQKKASVTCIVMLMFLRSLTGYVPCCWSNHYSRLLVVVELL